MSQGKRTVSRVIAGVIAAIVVAAAIATGLSAKALSNALDNQGKLPDDAESAQSADSGASDGAQSSSSDVPAGSTGADSGLYHTVPSADHDVVDEDTGLRFIDNELVVYVKGGTDSEEFSQYVQGFGGEIVGYIDAVNSYQVRFGDAYSYDGLRELADELEESDMVKRALPNLVSSWGASAETGDPAWDSDDDVWGYRAIHLADAWDDVVASGGVTVGVLDNQFFQHEDLAFSDISSSNYDDNAASPSHGTHVSGTIAAMSNSSGSVGVAYGCSLAAYSWLSDIIDDGDREAVSATDNFSFNVGVAYLVARKNARVVNISASRVGDGGESLAFCATRGNQDALNIVRAHAEHGTVFLSTLLESHDFLICKAAGNDNNDEYVSVNGPTTVVDEHGSNRTFRLGYVPYKYADQVYSTEKQIADHLDDDGDVDAANDVMGHITESDVANHIVMVGAAGRASRGGNDYRVSNFSNAGRRVDLVAPGEDIYSTVCENGRSDYSGDWSGTSMATPMVSGAAALVYSVDPTFTGDQVKDILDSTASGTYRYEDDRFSDSYSMLDVEAAVGEAQRLSGSDGGSGSAHERDIALVLDVSGSMEGEPLEEMQTAASKFSATVFQNDARVGVVAFDALAERVIGFTASQDKLDDAVDDMSAGSSTNIYDGLKHAALMLNASSANKRIIVLMTDGMPNEGLVGDELVAYADALKQQGVLMYTLGFFSSLDEGDKAEAQQLLERIASSGCHYEVTDASDLKFFFGDIADQINGVKYNYIRIACPVDVSVTYDGETLSSEGAEKAQRTSFGTLTFEQADAKAADGGSAQGDAGSSASSDADAGATGGADLVKVLRLREGPAYDVQISGTGSGSMDYTIGFVNDEGDYDDLRYFDGIDIGSRTEISTVAQRTDVTQLDVDSDGDGRVDLTYAARANQHARLIDNVDISASAMALAASAVALIAAAVTFIWFILFGRRLFAR